MNDLYKMIIPFLNQTILYKYKFGFAGEVYIETDKFEEEYNQYLPILERYFSLKKQFPPLSFGLIDSIISDMKELNISNVREYSEMDNILIMFITYFALCDYIGEHDIIISPLQGAALIPPFFISMQKYTNIINRSSGLVGYEYVRFSKYDNTHYCELSLLDQVHLLSSQYPESTNILLIDDNTGTATTLKSIKQELLKNFKNISTFALEYYWEGKIFRADYPAFQLDEIDLITPLCYRHFKILEENLEFLKNGKDINFRYDLVKFSKINMIYDKIDYCLYINNNCTETSTKTRILSIYERIKEVMEILS